jgi:hypothetical protein
MDYTIILLAGFGGGVLRGLVGFIKHQFAYKEVKFNTGYFIFMMVLSGLVGLAAAWAIDGLGLNFLGLEFLTPALAFVIGYAGGDFIENIYKIIAKNPTLYPTN